MIPTFNQTMQQLGLEQRDDKLFINNDIILAGRPFTVMVIVGDKKCTLNVGEHPQGEYGKEKLMLTQVYDYNNDAGIAIYFSLSVLFMKQHLHHEFQNFVKDHAA